MSKDEASLATALAVMVNTFGTSHKELRTSETDRPTKFQIATQQARDALVSSGYESLIAEHLISAGVKTLTA